MRSLRLVLSVLCLLPGVGHAEEITLLEQQRALLGGHRARLESMLADQGRRIGRLKAQPAGVRRDFQLADALRESQGLATKLTRLRTQLREVTERLMRAYEAAIRRTGDAAKRKRLEDLRAGLADGDGGIQSRIVTGETASPMDTPDDLDEKADLLEDSEEKLRRQLRQVQTTLALLEQRVKLRRHSKAVDDNPFVEDSPRRTGQARTRTLATSSDASSGTETGKTNSPGTPPPSAVPADDHAGFSTAPGGARAGESDPGATGSSRTETIVSIRDVMDPAILQDPTASGRGDDLASRIAALRKANERLNQVAGQIGRQARAIRQRATALRKQK